MNSRVPLTFSRRLLAMTFATSLATGSAGAIDADGNYAVWGVGQASCHQYSKAFAADALTEYRAYVGGYLTAYNAMARDVYQATGKRTMTENLAAIRDYCAKNPIESVERGIQAALEAAATAAAATNAGAAWGRAAPAQ